MSESLGSAVLDLRTDSRRFDRGMNRAHSMARRFQGRLERVRNVVFSLQGALVGLGVGLGVREFVQAADTFSSLEGQLRIVTESTQELTKAQQELFKISQDTRTSYQSTVTLFSRVARANENLGATQRELFRFTELLNKGFVASGATATEAQNAIIQLSQGLASGELRGEEFRAVLEQGNFIVQEMAKSLNVTQGELMEMAFAGELTAKRVLSSVLRRGEQIDEQFQKMPLTVSQGVTRINNSFIKMAGMSSRASGAAGDLAEALTRIAEQVQAEDTIEATAEGLTMLVDAMSWMVEHREQVADTVAIFAAFHLGGPIVGGLVAGGVALNSIAEAVGANKTEVEGLVQRFNQAQMALERLQEAGGDSPKFKSRLRFMQNRVDELAGRLEEVGFLAPVELDFPELKQVESERNVYQEFLNRQLSPVEVPLYVKMPTAQFRNLHEELKAEGEFMRTQLEAELATMDTLWNEFERNVEDTEKATMDWGFTFSSAMEKAIMKGKSLGDVLKGIGRDILQMAARTAILNPLGNKVGGFFQNMFNFGGGRAEGGDVQAGKTYLVGEEGPELLKAGRTGTVVPNDKLGGGVTQQFNFDMVFPPELEAYIRNVAVPAGRKGAEELLAEQGGTI